MVCAKGLPRALRRPARVKQLCVKLCWSVSVRHLIDCVEYIPPSILLFPSLNWNFDEFDKATPETPVEPVGRCALHGAWTPPRLSRHLAVLHSTVWLEEHHVCSALNSCYGRLLVQMSSMTKSHDSTEAEPYCAFRQQPLSLQRIPMEFSLCFQGCHPRSARLDCLAASGDDLQGCSFHRW